MLKGRAFGQRTCFDQGAPNLRVSRRNAVFSRFNKPPVILATVKARQADHYLIGNTRGQINGWFGGRAIFGLARNLTR